MIILPIVPSDRNVLIVVMRTKLLLLSVVNTLYLINFIIANWHDIYIENLRLGKNKI